MAFVERRLCDVWDNDRTFDAQGNMLTGYGALIAGFNETGTFGSGNYRLTLLWVRAENRRTMRFPPSWPENPALASKAYPLQYAVSGAGRIPDIDSLAGNPDFPPIPGPEPEFTGTVVQATTAAGAITMFTRNGSDVCWRQWGSQAGGTSVSAVNAPINIRWDDGNQLISCG